MRFGSSNTFVTLSSGSSRHGHGSSCCSEISGTAGSSRSVGLLYVSCQ